MNNLAFNPFHELDQLSKELVLLEKKCENLKAQSRQLATEISKFDATVQTRDQQIAHWEPLAIAEENKCMLAEIELEMKNQQLAKNKMNTERAQKELDDLKTSVRAAKEQFIKDAHQTYRELNVFNGTFHLSWQNRINAKEKQLKAAMAKEDEQQARQRADDDFFFDDDMDTVCARVPFPTKVSKVIPTITIDE